MKVASAGFITLLAVSSFLGSVAVTAQPFLLPEFEHDERPDGPYVAVDRAAQLRSPAPRIERGGLVSVQVNVDENGDNIVGDAANEPSIAVDPTDPNRIVIGWRQFDSVANSFRQAGIGYSDDGGATWTVPEPLEAGVFRSDPVLATSADGTLYYLSLSVSGNFQNEMFTSTDGGQTWGPPVFAQGGDKAWFAADRSGGIGDGHLYQVWNSAFSCCGSNGFSRSVDGATTWDSPILLPADPIHGTTAVGPDGEVYVVGRAGTATGFAIEKSTTINDPANPVAVGAPVSINLGGNTSIGTGPNPGGLLGQVWVAVDSSDSPRRGDVYVLASVNPPGSDPMDVQFIRSTDGGANWSAPIRVNDDVGESWQWFASFDVSSTGRLDAVWADTRNDDPGLDSELFHSFSTDGGLTWSKNVAVSPPFDSLQGHPQQNKIGDYYHLVSTADGSHLTYSATFNMGPSEREQDVYYLFIPHLGNDLFSDGFESGTTAAWSSTVPTAD